MAPGCKPAGPAPLTDADRDAIRAAGAAFAAAMSKGDHDAASAIYVEDAILLPPGMPALTGRDAILDFMKMMPPMTAFSAEDLEIMGDGEKAVVRGTYSLTIEIPGSAPYTEKGKFIDVRVKQPDGKWLFKWDMFSPDVMPGAPPTEAPVELKTPPKK
jgi:uncharacterized protein (TIGR02246 family)